MPLKRLRFRLPPGCKYGKGVAEELAKFTDNIRHRASVRLIESIFKPLPLDETVHEVAAGDDNLRVLVLDD